LSHSEFATSILSAGEPPLNGEVCSSVCGFDGSERVDCTNCDCFGGWEWVEVDVDALIEAEETAVEVETFLNAPVATPMPLPVHEGMSAAFFDDGVRRAFANDLSISRTERTSVVAVSSTVDPDTYYSVTSTSCTCVGHAKVDRCLHRAFVCFLLCLEACDAVAEAAHLAAHPVPVEALRLTA